jgi:Leucine-rich repeat (LRR) protein
MRYTFACAYIMEGKGICFFDSSLCWKLIPACSCFLCGLSWLDFTRNTEDNGLIGIIPIEVGGLPYLQVLSLRNNELKGGLPVSLADRDYSQLVSGFYGIDSRLQVVDMSRNQLSGELVGLHKLLYIEELNISHNFFHGPLFEVVGPTSDSQFVKNRYLKVLDVSNCSFSGAIEAGSLLLHSIETLRFDDNDFVGSLPLEDFSSLLSLSVLSGSGNQLSGTFPWSSLSGAPLTRVGMANNKFSSIFLPASSSTLSLSTSSSSSSSSFLNPSLPATLEYIDFSGNLVVSNASIPESIGLQLSQLKGLRLASNQLTGTLPSTLGNLMLLETLDVSNNRLESSLPTELAKCESLEALLLNDNLFSGSVPEEYSHISSLREYCKSNICVRPNLRILERLSKVLFFLYCFA